MWISIKLFHTLMKIFRMIREEITMQSFETIKFHQIKKNSWRTLKLTEFHLFFPMCFRHFPESFIFQFFNLAKNFLPCLETALQLLQRVVFLYLTLVTWCVKIFPSLNSWFDLQHNAVLRLDPRLHMVTELTFSYHVIQRYKPNTIPQIRRFPQVQPLSPRCQHWCG